MQVVVREREVIRTRSRSPEARYLKNSSNLHLNDAVTIHHKRQKSGVPVGSRLHSSFNKQSKILERNLPVLNHGSQSRIVEYNESRDTTHEWNEMLTFRTYVIMRTQEEASPNEAIKAYENYKKIFHAQREPKFLWCIKNYPVMTERYSPELLQLEYDEAAQRCRVEASQFVKMIAEERFLGLSLVEQSHSFRSVAETALPTKIAVGKHLDSQHFSALTSPYWIPVDPDVNCICTRKLSSQISKWDLKKYLDTVVGSDNLIDISITEPNDFKLTLQGGFPSRTAWIRTVSDEACSVAELKLERATIKDTKLYPLCRVPNPQSYKFRVTPSEACHPARILRDLVLSAQLILKLDFDFGVTELLGGGDPQKDSFELSCSQHPVLFELQQVFVGSNRNAGTQLDLQLLYLRVVHSVCYYSGRRFRSPRHLWEAADVLYVRPNVDIDEIIRQFTDFGEFDGTEWDKEYIEARDLEDTLALQKAAAGPLFCEEENLYFEPPRAFDTETAVQGYRSNDQKNTISIKTEDVKIDSAAIKTEVALTNIDNMKIIRGRYSAWLRVLDNRIAWLLSEKIQDSMIPVTEEIPAVQEKWNIFCNKAITEIAAEKWRCELCTKMFRGVEFVKKHLKNKHSTRLDEIIAEEKDKLIVKNYQLDPYRHPIAPPIVTPYVYRRGLPTYYSDPASSDNVPASIDTLPNTMTLQRQQQTSIEYQYRDLDAPRTTDTHKIKNMRDTISYGDL